MTYIYFTFKTRNFHPYSFCYWFILMKSKSLTDRSLFNIIQILTGVQFNIDYVSPRGRKYCATRSGGQYIRPEGGNIINVAWKDSQLLFCYMKKQTNKQTKNIGLKTYCRKLHVSFSVRYKIHEFNSAWNIIGIEWLLLIFRHL